MSGVNNLSNPRWYREISSRPFVIMKIIKGTGFFILRGDNNYLLNPGGTTGNSINLVPYDNLQKDYQGNGIFLFCKQVR